MDLTLGSKDTSQPKADGYYWFWHQYFKNHPMLLSVKMIEGRPYVETLYGFSDIAFGEDYKGHWSAKVDIEVPGAKKPTNPRLTLG